MRLTVLFIALCLLTACEADKPGHMLGTLERDRIILRATAAEIVVSQQVEEGDTVQAGARLLQLDDKLQQARVAQAQAELQSADAELDKLRNGARQEDVAAAQAGVDRALAREREALKNFQRARSLFQKKLIGEADLDAARAQSDSSEAELVDARESLLRLTNGSRPEDLRRAEAKRQAAKAVLQQTRQQLNQLTVVATRAGIVDSLPSQIGERVNVGQPLAVLLADEAPYARIYLPETLRAGVAVGDKLSLSVDGVAEPFQGRLRWISMEPSFTPYYALTSRDRARLVYLAEVQLPDSARALPAGVPVQARLAAEE